MNKKLKDFFEYDDKAELVIILSVIVICIILLIVIRFQQPTLHTLL